MKITAIWESPTNEGTMDIVVGRDYMHGYDSRLRGLGKCLSIIGKQGAECDYYEVTFENGIIFLNEAAVGTRHEPE